MKSTSTLAVIFYALTYVTATTAAAAEPGNRTITVQMTSGEKITGSLLKRDDRSTFLYVGGTVVRLDNKQIRNIGDTRGARAEVEDTKDFKLYKTGKLPTKNVQALVEELGQAIVVVKTPAGLGTGWFCNQEGYIITNNHVVAGERSVTVTMFHKKGDGFGKKVFKKVRIIALNDDIDLALLKIEEKIDIPYPQLYLGDSTRLKVGDKVFAVGNPMGLERSTSQGIVSKAARNVGGRLYLQVTAPIAPGNSGGPLFNERGEVVGVVNMGYIILDGLGFAIPSKYVKEFLDNVEAFAYDADNPNTGTQYMEAPVSATDKSFRFLSSDYIKTGYGVSCLTIADLDRNRVSEAVFVNNNKAEIGIMRFCKNVDQARQLLDYEDINTLSDSAHFKVETIPMRSRVTSIAVADINRDKRPDILFLGDVDGLAVMEQKKDGTFAAPRTIDRRVKPAQRRNALRVVDLDQDGRQDIFVLGMDRFSIFWAGDKRKDFPLASIYKSNIKDIFFTDVNRDRRLDIVFFTASKYYATYIRVQNREREFLQDIPVRSHLSGVVKRFTHNRSRSFLTLDNGLNRVREVNLEQTRAKPEPGKIPAGLIAIPVDPKSSVTAQVELGALGPDGGKSLVAVDRSRNQFHVYTLKNGELRLSKSPAPAQVTIYKLFIAKGRGTLFSLSRKDKIFGVSRISSKSVTFPRPLNTRGEVEWFDLVSWPKEEGRRLIWVEKDSGKYTVKWISAATLMEKVYQDRHGSIDIEPGTFSFADARGRQAANLRRKPTSLAVADFNGDDQPDLVVYWSYSGKESLYLGQGNGAFKAIIKDRKFIDEQKGQPLIAADLDGSGKKDVLLVRPGFVRVLKVDAREKLYVHKQFNWEFGKVRHFTLYNAAAKNPRFLALAGTQAYLVELDTNKGGFSLLDKLDLGGIESGAAKIGDIDGDGKTDIVMLGKGAISIFLQQPRGIRLSSRMIFNAKLDYFKYWNLHPADLDNDGNDELLLFDSKKAMFEVYRLGKDRMMHVLLRHRLFEKTIFQRSKGGKLELPQELVIGDLDGDKRSDMVCILQDRIAVYLQK